MPGSLGLLGWVEPGRGGARLIATSRIVWGMGPSLSYPAQRLVKKMIITGNKETGAGRTKALSNAWSNRSAPVASRRRPVEINSSYPVN